MYFYASIHVLMYSIKMLYWVMLIDADSVTAVAVMLI